MRHTPPPGYHKSASFFRTRMPQTVSLLYQKAVSPWQRMPQKCVTFQKRCLLLFVFYKREVFLISYSTN